MSLYRMELYKICRRKIIWITGFFIVAWMAFWFYAELVGSERATINGQTYQGYEAVKKNREITKEFEGELTDEKIKQIIEKYGFPKEVKENIGWMDSNYLTEFVVEYFSDGYLYHWDNYKVAENTKAMKDSDLADFLNDSGKNLYLGYAKGNKGFFKFFQMEMYFVSVWLIIAFAPLFCEERQFNVYPLICVAEKGRNEDAIAKILAAFTVTVTSFCLAVFIPLFACWKIFGLGGSKMVVGSVLGIRSFMALSHKSTMEFTVIYVCMVFGAMLMLTATSIWVSAKVRTNFASIVISAVIWVLPIVLLFTGSGRIWYIFLSACPALRVDYMCIAETWIAKCLHMAIMVFTVCAGIRSGRKSVREVDVE